MRRNSYLRWLRFSLKSLFLLILVVAAYFAGWRSALSTAEREKEEAIRKAIEELHRMESQRSPDIDLAVGYVPELGLVTTTGADGYERAQRFLEMRQLSGRRNGFGGLGAKREEQRETAEASSPSSRPAR